METTEWKWHTKDGLEIYSKAWLPPGQPKAVVALVHGVGEHIGRYQADAEAFNAAGYGMAGFDIRGFGRSAGPKGHVPSLEAYFDDIDLFMEEVGLKFPGVPRFLYGHSMGAVLVLAYVPVRRPDVKGVIVTGAGLRSAIEDQKAKLLLTKVLGGMLPTLSFPNGVDVPALSRDPQVEIDYLKDPLVHDKITTGWGKTMLQAVQTARQNAGMFPKPLLLMHGAADQVAYPISSTSFAEAAPKDKVTLKMWEGMKHELHTDTEKAEVFKVMVDWMNQRV